MGAVIPGREYLPIYGLVISLVGDDLGRKIIRCSTERPCLIRNALSESEIGDLQVAMPVK